ncbi:MAG TPA: hypothetical protein VIN59_03720 [Alphaproteobacteria bacterium]
MNFFTGDLSKKYNQYKRDMALINRQRRMFQPDKIVPGLALSLLWGLYSREQGALGQIFATRADHGFSFAMSSVQQHHVPHYHVKEGQQDMQWLDRTYEQLKDIAERIEDAEGKAFALEAVDHDNQAALNGDHDAMFVPMHLILTSVAYAARDRGLWWTQRIASWQGTGSQLANYYADINGLRACNDYVEPCEGVRYISISPR